MVEARIERSESVLTNQLSLYGLGVMRLGAFVVEMTEAGVAVTKIAPNGAEQLQLPKPHGDPQDAEDHLSPADTLDAIVAWAAGDDGFPEDFLVGIDELRAVVKQSEGGGFV